MGTLIIRNEIAIDAPMAKVWDVLTKGEYTKQYMHGCETVSGWKLGDTLEWKGVWDGIEMVAVKGNIVGIEPGHYLAYTTIDPNNTVIADTPENHLTVTYTLSEMEDQTILVVTQGDYNKVDNGIKRYEDSTQAGGWSSILVQIKKIAEEA